MAGFVDKLRTQRKHEKLAREMTHRAFTPPNNPIGDGLASWGRDVRERVTHPTETMRGAIERLQTAPVEELAMDWSNPVPVGLAGIFAGKGARTANLAMLAQAEKLAKSGVPDDVIWKQTGWTLDTPDKMPRFEIPDDASKIDFPASGGKSSSQDAYDVISHRDLQSAYPNAPSLKIVNKDDPTFKGAYFNQLDGITVMQPSESLAKSTTLHELQHAIQQREGFARGGSPEAMKSVFVASDPKIVAAASQIRDMAQKYGISVDDIIAKPPKYLREDVTQDAVRYLAKNDEAFANATTRSLDPHEQYRRLAGEAEARLTQARMNMTPEQRLAQYPYQPEYFEQATGVPLNSLIVRKDGGTAMSLPAKTEFELAHEVAQRNAALPIEQGGLGLPPNNTAMDRAKAMGADVNQKQPATTVDQATKEFWDALDDAGDGYIGIRGDNNLIKKKFRNSWNSPDGNKTTRLPGLSVVGVGQDNITKKIIEERIRRGMDYGDNLYLIEGSAPSHIQYLANDPGERLLTENKILHRVDNVGDTSTFNTKIDSGQLRSRFAAFDPMQRNSANLLAGGIGGAIGLSTLADLINRDEYQ